MLGLRAGVEAHEEVVPGVMFRLMVEERLREKKGAPVREAADYALPRENKISGGFGDSMKRRGCVSWAGGWRWMQGVKWGGEDELFHFGELAGSDLVRLSGIEVSRARVVTYHGDELVQHLDDDRILTSSATMKQDEAGFQSFMLHDSK